MLTEHGLPAKHKTVRAQEVVTPLNLANNLGDRDYHYFPLYEGRNRDLAKSNTFPRPCSLSGGASRHSGSQDVSLPIVHPACLLEMCSSSVCACVCVCGCVSARACTCVYVCVCAQA